MTEDFPIKKYDYLNRLIYIDWDGNEKIINKYWGKSKSIKIKYRIFGNDINTEAYDEQGKLIINYMKGRNLILLDRIRVDNFGIIEFKVDKNIMKRWRKKIKD